MLPGTVFLECPVSTERKIDTIAIMVEPKETQSRAPNLLMFETVFDGLLFFVTLALVQVF
jgi:hypothetical protein